MEINILSLGNAGDACRREISLFLGREIRARSLVSYQDARQEFGRRRFWAARSSGGIWTLTSEESDRQLLCVVLFFASGTAIAIA
ncbi:hypothetical protein CEXT_562941 [Caerostris extrusa]|uniref:Uncharacterized protein n=1 Tax=Caerostris extrusa TaxID=172846 RepID=A0AAV4WRR9_CAEEX|nr:hypothetical protein CEXT_562941 [Caerostris extrusa]